MSQSSSNPPSAGHVDAEHPWPGLYPYTEDQAPYFYGREAEAELLLQRVRQHPLTVLFGQSGFGKSSLLQAGLYGALREAALAPIEVRFLFDAEAVTAVQQVRNHVNRGLAELRKRCLQVEPAQLNADDAGLAASLRAISIRQPSGEAVTPVYIFDQFEEVFTRGSETARRREGVEQLMRELADLVERRSGQEEGGTNFRMVLALREDYLAHLESWRQEMPSLLENRMRLSAFDGQAALRAITEPAEARIRDSAELPPLVPPSVSRQLIRLLAGDRESVSTTGSWEELVALRIDPGLLSFVMRELSERRGDALQITPELVHQTGEVKGILRNYYDRTIKAEHAAVRVLLEEELLTEQGFRASVSVDKAEEFLRARGGDVGAIERLIKHRLLRVEERLEQRHLELSHDVLCRPLGESRAARRGQERIWKRLRELGVAAIFLVVVSSLGMALWALAHGQELAKLTAEARRQRDKAISEEEKTREAKAEADKYLKGWYEKEIVTALSNRNASAARLLLAEGREKVKVDQNGAYALTIPGRQLELLRDFTLPAPLLHAAYSADARWIGALQKGESGDSRRFLLIPYDCGTAKSVLVLASSGEEWRMEPPGAASSPAEVLSFDFSVQPQQPGFCAVLLASGEVCLVDLSTKAGRLLPKAALEQISALRFSPDGKRLYFGTRNGLVGAVDTETWVASLTFSPFKVFPHPWIEQRSRKEKFTFSPVRVPYSYNEPSLSLKNNTVQSNGEVSTLRFDNNERHVLAIDENGELSVLNLQTRGQRSTAAGPDGAPTGREDSDPGAPASSLLPTERPLRSAASVLATSGVLDACFSAAGDRVAAVMEGTVEVYSMARKPARGARDEWEASNRHQTQIKWNSTGITRAVVRFSPDGKKLTLLGTLASRPPTSPMNRSFPEPPSLDLVSSPYSGYSERTRHGGSRPSKPRGASEDDEPRPFIATFTLEEKNGSVQLKAGPVTRLSENLQEFTFSPDGARIFLREQEKNVSSLKVWSLAGGITPLTSAAEIPGARITGLEFAPDNLDLLVFSEAGGAIYQPGTSLRLAADEAPSTELFPGRWHSPTALFLAGLHGTRLVRNFRGAGGSAPAEVSLTIGKMEPDLVVAATMGKENSIAANQLRNSALNSMDHPFTPSTDYDDLDLLEPSAPAGAPETSGGALRINSEELKAHSADISALAFSEDSSALFSAAKDGSVRLWKCRQPHQSTNFPLAALGQLSIAFSAAPPGTLLATDGYRVFRWDTQQREFTPLPAPLDGSTPQRVLALTPTYAITHALDPKLEVIELSTGRAAWPIRTSPTLAPKAVAITRDGRWLALQEKNGHLFLLRQGSPENVAAPDLGEAKRFAFAGDDLLAIINSSNVLQLYQPSTGKSVRAPKLPLGVPVLVAGYEAGGTPRLVVALKQSEDIGGFLVYHSDLNREPKVVPLASVTRLAIDPQAEFLIAVGEAESHTLSLPNLESLGRCGLVGDNRAREFSSTSFESETPSDSAGWGSKASLRAGTFVIAPPSNKGRACAWIEGNTVYLREALPESSQDAELLEGAKLSKKLTLGIVRGDARGNGAERRTEIGGDRIEAPDASRVMFTWAAAEARRRLATYPPGALTAADAAYIVEPFRTVTGTATNPSVALAQLALGLAEATSGAEDPELSLRRLALFWEPDQFADGNHSVNAHKNSNRLAEYCVMHGFSDSLATTPLAFRRMALALRASARLAAIRPTLEAGSTLSPPEAVQKIPPELAAAENELREAQSFGFLPPTDDRLPFRSAATYWQRLWLDWWNNATGKEANRAAAELLLPHALVFEPQSCQLHLYLGHTQSSKALPERARAYQAAAAFATPGINFLGMDEYPIALANIAINELAIASKLASDKAEEAKRFREHALALIRPETVKPEMEEALPFRALGDALISLGDHGAGLRAYRTALKKHVPQTASIQRKIVEVYRELGQTEKAIEEGERQLKGNPSRAANLTNFAADLLQAGYLAEARVQMDKARNQEKKDALPQPEVNIPVWDAHVYSALARRATGALVGQLRHQQITNLQEGSRRELEQKTEPNYITKLLALTLAASQDKNSLRSLEKVAQSPELDYARACVLRRLKREELVEATLRSVVEEAEKNKPVEADDLPPYILAQAQLGNGKFAVSEAQRFMRSGNGRASDPLLLRATAALANHAHSGSLRPTHEFLLLHRTAFRKNFALEFYPELDPFLSDALFKKVYDASFLEIDRPTRYVQLSQAAAEAEAREVQANWTTEDLAAIRAALRSFFLEAVRRGWREWKTELARPEFQTLRNDAGLAEEIRAERRTLAENMRQELWAILDVVQSEHPKPVTWSAIESHLDGFGRLRRAGGKDPFVRSYLSPSGAVRLDPESRNDLADLFADAAQREEFWNTRPQEDP